MDHKDENGKKNYFGIPDEILDGIFAKKNKCGTKGASEIFCECMLKTSKEDPVNNNDNNIVAI